MTAIRQEEKGQDKRMTRETTRTCEASFVQSENTKTCYCCDKKGHMSPKYLEKDKIPKEDWAICKAEQHMQAEHKHRIWTRLRRKPDGAVCMCV